MAQVLMAMGLTYWSMTAEGATSIMSAQMLHRCGTVRRPRMMPPTPSVSAMVWRRPKPLRDLEVRDGRGLVAADLEAHDDEVGAVERPALVREGLDAGLAAQRLGELADHNGRLLQALGVDVHEADRGAAQRLAVQDVARDVLGEHGAARADERDGRHGLSLRSLCQRRRARGAGCTRF
jgi:hypothetical protein